MDNNEASQLRFSGKNNWPDGVTIVVDKDSYEGSTEGGGFNEQYGSNGIKIDRGDNGCSKPGGAVIRNADILVRSVGYQGIGAAIFVRGNAGAVKIENTWIINRLNQLSVSADSLGNG